MASVTFKRTNNIDSVPITDGQLIFDTSDQKIYLDNGNTREVYGGGSGTDLISNVSDATDNNAFNANATVNLFTRKSSIVDTKAEIQSVTQAGVPLGCKGFNEVIGTGDISALGDGSVTGAILANKSAIDTVNQNLTQKNVRWNPDTKYYEVQWNGIWYQDRYFDPTWNGIVMDGGNYDSNWYSTTWSANTGVPSGYSAVGATSISYNTNGQNIVTKSAYNNLAIAWTECVMSKAINVGRPCKMTVWYQYSPQGVDTAQMKPIIALKTTNTTSGSSCGHVTSGTPYTDIPRNSIASQKISNNSGSVVLTINSTYAKTDLYLDVVASMYDAHANNPKNTLTIKKIQIAYT